MDAIAWLLIPLAAERGRRGHGWADLRRYHHSRTALSRIVGEQS
ncbi:hypothetical protein [Streptomyces orinoci]|uniref:Transposase n=1 Tax=Streptomyces orinoci TaxID=67339 RepID=A0ABV3JUQ6_STRON|nr:hypothetical protein [Streptomyces orinoci]